MLKWTIGQVTVTRVVEFENTIDYDPAMPFITNATPEALAEIPWLVPDHVSPEGGLKLSVHALLVEAPGVKLVIDPCIGNDKPRQMLGGIALDTPFLQRFAETGWRREDVDVVLCTHLHIDHVGWNTMREGDRWVPTFPRAQYLFGRKEYEHWTSGAEQAAMDQPEIMADSVQPVVDAGLVTLVETDHRICNELRLIPTIGHTPGHVSLVIESEGHTAIIGGDIMHHPCQVARPAWATLVDSDVDMARETRLRVLDAWSDRPILYIGTHFAPPTAGYLLRDGDTYRFEGATQ